jgi:hypothetical protein
MIKWLRLFIYHKFNIKKTNQHLRAIKRIIGIQERRKNLPPTGLIWTEYPEIHNYDNHTKNEGK